MHLNDRRVTEAELVTFLDKLAHTKSEYHLIHVILEAPPHFFIEELQPAIRAADQATWGSLLIRSGDVSFDCHLKRRYSIDDLGYRKETIEIPPRSAPAMPYGEEREPYQYAVYCEGTTTLADIFAPLSPHLTKETSVYINADDRVVLLRNKDEESRYHTSYPIGESKWQELIQRIKSWF